ncbi:MAG: DUF4347 domain-containing protein [Cyanobacteria bacterium P01_F01_bin.53]
MFSQFPESSSSSDIRSIAFVDSGISDADSLIAGLSDHHVIQLPSEANGIEAITQALSQYQNLDSIHVFSHGENGSLQLGNATLSQAFLSEYQSDLQRWGQALTGEGDLLFYGCDFAAGGDHFIEQISQATGADVAASNDLTGKGGDWQLEVTTGSIESSVALDQATQASYQGQLNLLTNGSFEANVVDNDRWTNLNAVDVAGWQSLNGERLELWDSGHSGVTSSDGTNHLELDYVGGSNLDAIYQDIQTQTGQTYTLTFDVRSRGANFNSDNEAVVVEWNGQALQANGFRAFDQGVWTTITTEVVGTGGIDRLLLRESSASGASNGLGPLLDNVSLEANQPPISEPPVNEPPANELLVNGSFEANAVDNDQWSNWNAADVAGWQSLNGERLEIWDSGHSGVTSSDGTNHLELDYVGSSNLDGIYQDIQTQAGATYTLTFDVRSRGANFNSDNEAVVVEWNGQTLQANGFRASGQGVWTTITTEVVGTDGTDRLTFSESGSTGASNGLGPLLDNISLKGSAPQPPEDDPTPPTNFVGLENGSFEANAVDKDQWSNWNAADVAGWQSLNGERLEIWDSGHSGVTSSEGTNHLELDYVGSSNLDGIYQDIQTQAGETYRLTFDTRARTGSLDSPSETTVVEWNGAVINTTTQSVSNNGWTTLTAIVTGSGGSDRLTLRESDAAGASDGSGPLLDNIVLRPASEVIENPSPTGAGFTRQTLVSGLDNPLAFTYADDGRIFVTEKAGRVKIIENGQVVSTFIDINAEVNSYWDRGLMGIALDPDFDNNGWVYLSYVVDLEPETPDRADFNSAASGRLIRVKVSDANPNVADLSTREVILDGHKMTHATHAVGDVDFDNDGNLIFSWGDGGFGDNLRFEAQDPDSKQGKFFRIDPKTGFGIPENPYYDPANPDSVRSKVWVTGVRNPWRWSVDRPTGDVYFGEVTDGGPEEANVIRAGATEPEQLNYGWPYFEGNNRTRYGTVPDNFVYEGAYVELPHGGGLDAITGGAVYRGTAYPDIYDGRYFFANFYRVLYTADAEGNYQQFGNVGDVSGVSDLQLAPNGTIQYLSLFDGALYQLNYDPASGEGLIPNAVVTASVTAGTGPLTVNFNSSESNSPNGDSLSYAWDFESDGTIDSTAANPSHTYRTVGKQTATLTVTDDVGGTDTTQVEITLTNSQPNDGNLAFGKPTFQSSTAAGAIASRAVDGNTNNSFAAGSVTATTLQDKAFWEIDLGAIYNLSSVQIFVGNQPLSNYYVLASDEEFTGGNLSALLEEPEVWRYNNPNQVSAQDTIAINDTGRYLRIQLAELGLVSLAEVKIFGTPV